MELDPATEKLAQAKAEVKGLTIADYLPALVAQAVQEEEWQTPTPAFGHPSPAARERGQ